MGRVSFICAVLLAWVATVNEPLADPAVMRSAFKQGLAAMTRGDYAKARPAFERALAHGAKGAAYNLGLLYWNGWGVAANPKKACDYFAIAASARLPKPTHNLAGCYYHGVGRPRDYPRAATLYRRAAALGHPPAHCALGNMYRRGQGVGRDVRRGIALCRKAAEAGDADAQADLGAIFLSGEGVPIDRGRAAKWMQRAARQGQPNAQAYLGVMYLRGDGVARDNALAACWLLAAAYRRQPRAPFALGRIYFDRGIKPRERLIIDEPAAKSLFWFGMAAQVDPSPARRKRAAKLVKTFLRIKPSLRPRIQAEARRWRSRVVRRSVERRFTPARCP